MKYSYNFIVFSIVYTSRNSIRNHVSATSHLEVTEDRKDVTKCIKVHDDREKMTEQNENLKDWNSEVKTR